MKRKQQLQIRSLLQVLEHVGFCILLFLFLSGQFSFNYSSQTSDNVHQIKIQPKSQQFIANGNSFAIFEREDVHPAPAASMSMDSVEIGDYTQFHDTRGDIYKFKLGKDVMVNMYRTEKGFMRSGDLHNCTQYDISLKGDARLTMKDLDRDQEDVMVVKPFELVAIPPRMPHMFEFLEENYLLEWWSCDFQAWYYTPYRSIVDETTNTLLQEKQN
eukprot:TRINITY_DN10522_c1_g1_i4.p1 TRINITY_DN10522_c1_g1~~TRINITY_DN10522_c1_g1_i4.p1  ORF type:complete len:229 (-),score=17.29 TRINITY_DN10522_c1_g1_i4:348-992(-)